MSAPVIEDDPLPDSPLYHYTDAGGLHGILEKETLWATHAGYLNDSQEFVFGIQKAQAALKQLAQNPPDDMQISHASPQEMLTLLKYSMAVDSLSAKLSIATVSVRDNHGPFVTCLSESSDQLSQWRGYGKGGGYSIQFNTQKLRESVQGHNAEHRFVRMRYERRDNFDPSLRQQLIQYVKDVTSLLPSVPSPSSSADADAKQKIDNVVEPVLASALHNAMRQKHWGFREEKECRIVAFGTAHFHTPQETGLIPRMEITFDPRCIEGIMIGPGQHMETREASVRSYIQKHSDRYQHVKVTSSETPFTGI
ncbi:DUF2971 domain-containing protein [Mycobacterium simiae]|nr:DUF2971 domain-containing protein [Mycobacterium simiae]